MSEQMTLQEAHDRAVEQYKAMVAEYEETTNRLGTIRETMLRQEGYITALQQVLGGVNHGSEETLDSEGHGENGKEGNEGEFAQSLKRAKRRANTRPEVVPGTA
jgi:hypothetical protein